MKYTKLKKLIKRMVKHELLHSDEKDKLFELVVNEYEECSDNPEDATMQDLCEIADASNLKKVDSDDEADQKERQQERQKERQQEIEDFSKVFFQKIKG